MNRARCYAMGAESDVERLVGDVADVPELNDRTRRRWGRSGVRLGVAAWSFVGAVVALVIVCMALGAVTEIVLPLTFAAVLAVIFKPVAADLERRGMNRAVAAGLVVVGLLVLMFAVTVATVKGVVEQVDEISAVTDAALIQAGGELDEIAVDEAALQEGRAAVESAAPMLGRGVLTAVVSGIGAVLGLATGVILGTLIMYYMLKDSSQMRASLVDLVDVAHRGEVDSFVTDTCTLLRDYGKGRTVMSIAVASVVGVASLLLGLPLVFTIVIVNFIGGYIPYVGAFLGGTLAVIVALGDEGLVAAAIMLVVLLAANLVLENLLEPKVMGNHLAIHPMVVLIVTALGGLLGGIVGLLLAVPFYAIARSGLRRLRTAGVVDTAIDRVTPAARQLLG